LVVAGGYDSPKQFSVEVEEGICAIQVNGAGNIYILGQDGIIEACTRVVSVNIEVLCSWLVAPMDLRWKCSGGEVLATGVTIAEAASIRRGVRVFILVVGVGRGFQVGV
jgi:hypothetical protein